MKLRTDSGWTEPGSRMTVIESVFVVWFQLAKTLAGWPAGGA